MLEKVVNREMEDLDFVIDCKPSEGQEVKQNVFPKFSTSRYLLESEGEDESSKESEAEEDSEDYFGKFKHFLFSSS